MKKRQKEGEMVSDTWARRRSDGARLQRSKAEGESEEREIRVSRTEQ